jgi:hypothetical protein
MQSLQIINVLQKSSFALKNAQYSGRALFKSLYKQQFINLIIEIQSNIKYYTRGLTKDFSTRV